MKLVLGAALFFAVIGTAMAGAGFSKGKWRLADASTDACFASCASQNQFLQKGMSHDIQPALLECLR